MQSTRLTPIVGEVLERQCRFYAFPTSHSMTETGLFVGDPIVGIHQDTASQPRSLISINPLAHSLPAPASAMQMVPHAMPISTPLHQSQPTVQVAANVNMIISPHRLTESRNAPYHVEQIVLLWTKCSFFFSIRPSHSRIVFS